MRAFLGSRTSLGLLLVVILASVALAVPVTETTTVASSSSEETTEVEVDVATTTLRTTDEDGSDNAVNTALETSLESFLELIPSDKVKNMTAAAYLESGAVREASNFLRSREFRDAKDKLLEAAEVQEFVNFLNQSGLNLVRFVRKVAARTGIPVTLPVTGEAGQETAEENSSEEQAVSSSEAATVLTELVDKVLAEMPQDQFFAAFFEKMESDSEMSQFVERLNGDEFEAILLKVQESKALDQFQKTMLDHNMNLEKIWLSMKIFFGWGNNF